ncbi:nuclear transport factor 2 family protein [Photobacterium sp. 1_MG-2023]|uniref:nuclear transport factor 2 family protein n=1 Tax=Photobacterium sp. 1_MG-2023 TaxID=3062646 RepID=UPI0026E313E3|nr:nuclear transport factor 2 family protein [Photobacterium sp. 1_MG-2023]MDO6708607.1 nuclear transport factor 2 family protein [Photobacterium sp. 1_MG-2023]
MDSHFINEVRHAEAQLKQAMLSSDTDQLSVLLAEDLIFTNHLGQRLTRDHDLSAHISGLVSIDSIETSEELIRQIGTFAIVSLKADINGQYDGQPANGCFRFTRIWLKKNGKLQVKAAHASMIA